MVILAHDHFAKWSFCKGHFVDNIFFQPVILSANLFNNHLYFTFVILSGLTGHFVNWSCPKKDSKGLPV
jgi:hypothetical protein